MHQLDPSDLKDLLKCSMSSVFTILCATNQTNVLTLDDTLDFHINLVGEKRTILYLLDKAMKNDLTKNNLEEINDHALSYLGRMEISAHEWGMTWVFQGPQSLNP